jgi:steroid delta-isomerase-like uncharacterized protein
MTDDSKLQRNKAIVKRFYEDLWSSGDRSAVDEIIAEDLVHEQLPEGWPSGREGFKQLLDIWHAAFPDLVEDVQWMIAEGDWVAVRFVVSGTHEGDFYGIPATQRRIELPGMDMLRVHDGAIAEWIYAEDTISFFRQLGKEPEDWSAVAF